MKRWPFISRTTYDETKQELSAQIVELKAQVAELNNERKRLLDRIFMGLQGLPVYDTIPGELLPNEATSEVEKKPDIVTAQVPTDLEEAIAKHGPRARRIVDSVSKMAEKDFPRSLQVDSIFAKTREEALNTPKAS